MLYAIIESGGKQFRVEKGMRLRIPLMDIATDEELTFDSVLLCSNGTDVCVGTPTVDNASVKATSLGEVKDEKIRVFKMKRRKKYRRTQGHRQGYTEVRIDALNVPISDVAAAEEAQARAEAISAAADEADAADASQTS